jgi:hypothetical protein
MERIGINEDSVATFGQEYLHSYDSAVRGVSKRFLHPAIPVNTQYNFSFTFSTPGPTLTFTASNRFMYFAPQDSDCPLKPLNLTLPANPPFMPVPLSRLLLENPTARQVLQDTYDQLLDPELAILRPVVELLVCQSKPGCSLVAPLFAPGSIYPVLEPPTQAQWDALLAAEYAARESDEVPTDFVAPFGSVRAALTLLLHYPPECSESKSMYCSAENKTILASWVLSVWTGSRRRTRKTSFFSILFHAGRKLRPTTTAHSLRVTKPERRSCGPARLLEWVSLWGGIQTRRWRSCSVTASASSQLLRTPQEQSHSQSGSISSTPPQHI